jgi:uncharacterized protein YbbK (DUF523 family)
MQRIFVSACLLGQKVRYDGNHKLCDDEVFGRWAREGRIISLCPEMAGGFPTPRAPAEIADAQDGAQVLEFRAKVIEQGGRDVTAGFLQGAAATLQLCQAHQIRIAVLKEGSPSCGSSYTYDGSFTGHTIPKSGVTAALLRKNGIFVFSELELEAAQMQLKNIETVRAV